MADDQRIPRTLAERPEFVSACADLDMAEVFRLVRKWTGLSNSAMGRLTGLGGNRVGELINGRRYEIKKIDLIEAIADGLGIPGALLSLAPRRWESEALSAQASVTPDLQAWQLGDVLTRSTVSPVALGQMERAAMQFAGLYPSTPPEQLMPHVLGLSSRVYEVLAAPSSLRIRRRVVQVAGILAGLAGHLQLDLGNRDQAASFYEVGRIAGEEAEDDGLVAWVLTTQSIGQFFEGDPATAVEYLTEAARLTEGGANPRRHAWVNAQLASVPRRKSAAEIGSRNDPGGAGALTAARPS